MLFITNAIVLCKNIFISSKLPYCKIAARKVGYKDIKVHCATLFMNKLFKTSPLCFFHKSHPNNNNNNNNNNKNNVTDCSLATASQKSQNYLNKTKSCKVFIL